MVIDHALIHPWQKRRIGGGQQGIAGQHNQNLIALHIKNLFLAPELLKIIVAALRLLQPDNPGLRKPDLLPLFFQFLLRDTAAAFLHLVFFDIKIFLAGAALCGNCLFRERLRIAALRRLTLRGILRQLLSVRLPLIVRKIRDTATARKARHTQQKYHHCRSKPPLYPLSCLLSMNTISHVINNTAFLLQYPAPVLLPCRLFSNFFRTRRVSDPYSARMSYGYSTH